MQATATLRASKHHTCSAWWEWGRERRETYETYNKGRRTGDLGVHAKVMQARKHARTSEAEQLVAFRSEMLTVQPLDANTTPPRCHAVIKKVKRK